MPDLLGPQGTMDILAQLERMDQKENAVAKGKLVQQEQLDLRAL